MSITNEFIQQTLPLAKQYCLFILKPGPSRNQPNADQIQWEHTLPFSVKGRRHTLYYLPCYG